MEVFFLNDDDEYTHIALTPRGEYFLYRNNGYRNYVSRELQLYESGGPTLENPCLDEAEPRTVRPGCNDRWRSTITIPRYLPIN